MPSSASRQTTEILSSRTSREAAGWGCTDWADPTPEYDPERARPGVGRKQFSWVSSRPLWESRNDKIARWFGDPTDAERKRWVQAQRRLGRRPEHPDHALRRRATKRCRSWFSEIPARATTPSTRCCGRSEEGSQEPTSPTSSATSFTRPATSRITTTSSTTHIRDCRARSTRFPGNHDWYDGLHGFMTLLCGADPDLRPPVHASEESLEARVPRSHLAGADEALQEEIEGCSSTGPRPPASGPLLRNRAEGARPRRHRHGHPSGIDAEQGEWFGRCPSSRRTRSSSPGSRSSSTPRASGARSPAQPTP